MKRWLLVALAVIAVALVGAYWLLTGGLPDREPAAWLTKRAIAHRGEWLADPLRPENSLEAFKAAARNGHAIELDAQLSADGQVVVMHDYELDSMTGETGAVASRTLAELEAIPLSGGPQTIPSLRRALEAVDGRVPIFIEIKNEGEVGRLEDEVARLLDGYEGEVAVMSFNPYSLARFAETAPSIPRGQLSSALRDEDLAFYEVFLLRNLMMNWVSKPDFIAYDLAELPGMTTRIQRWRGRPLMGWTAKTPAERDAAAEFCDAVICDPEALP